MVIRRLLSTLIGLADQPVTRETECTVTAERIIGGVRLICSEGTVLELTSAECLRIAEAIGVIGKP